MMAFWIVLGVLGAILGIAAAFGVAVLAGRRFRGQYRRTNRPCYRCGTVVASGDYMGLWYCRMCLVVVPRMMAVVRHDPPFGFPGADGYLDFVVIEKTPKMKKKKED